MKKVIIVLGIGLMTIIANAQEITQAEKPIYKHHHLTIRKSPNDTPEIHCVFKNSEYVSIYDPKTIVFEDKEQAILFFEKCIEMLDMKRPEKGADYKMKFDAVSEQIIARRSSPQAKYISFNVDGGYFRTAEVYIKALKK